MHNPCCCCACNDSDIVLLTDSTASMWPYIGAIQSIFASLRTNFESPTCQWCVADYKDHEDGGDYALTAQGVKIRQSFTTDFNLVVAAINGISAGGGGDWPEENFAAIKHIAENWTALGGRTDEQIKRVLIWGGDAPSLNGGAKSLPYPTRSSTLDALTTARIKVFALNVLSESAGIDDYAPSDNLSGQASALCAATGGMVFHNTITEEQIVKALCEALR